MTRELDSIDVSTIPELARLVDEVQRTRTPRLLRRDNRDVAVLAPAIVPEETEAAERAARPLRFPKGGVVAATAGIVRYDGPPLTVEEEREAFERAVAEEVAEGMRG